jgi:hypothetical protein
MNTCNAEVAAPNEDGYLQCEREEGHLGPHWDPAYGTSFTTHTTDPG